MAHTPNHITHMVPVGSRLADIKRITIKSEGGPVLLKFFIWDEMRKMFRPYGHASDVTARLEEDIQPLVNNKKGSQTTGKVFPTGRSGRKKIHDKRGFRNKLHNDVKTLLGPTRSGGEASEEDWSKYRQLLENSKKSSAGGRPNSQDLTTGGDWPTWLSWLEPAMPNPTGPVNPPTGGKPPVPVPPQGPEDPPRYVWPWPSDSSKPPVPVPPGPDYEEVNPSWYLPTLDTYADVPPTGGITAVGRVPRTYAEAIADTQTAGGLTLDDLTPIGYDSDSGFLPAWLGRIWDALTPDGYRLIYTGHEGDQYSALRPSGETQNLGLTNFGPYFSLLYYPFSETSQREHAFYVGVQIPEFTYGLNIFGTQVTPDQTHHGIPSGYWDTGGEIGYIWNGIEGQGFKISLGIGAYFQWTNDDWSGSPTSHGYQTNQSGWSEGGMHVIPRFQIITTFKGNRTDVGGKWGGVIEIDYRGNIHFGVQFSW